MRYNVYGLSAFALTDDDDGDGGGATSRELLAIP